MGWKPPAQWTAQEYLTAKAGRDKLFQLGVEAPEADELDQYISEYEEAKGIGDFYEQGKPMAPQQPSGGGMQQALEQARAARGRGAVSPAQKQPMALEEPSVIGSLLSNLDVSFLPGSVGADSRPRTAGQGTGAPLDARSARVASGETVGTGEGFARGFSDVATSGLDAKMYGMSASLAGAAPEAPVRGLVPGGQEAQPEPTTGYERSRDEWRGKLGEAREDSPIATMAGGVTGAAAQALAASKIPLPAGIQAQLAKEGLLPAILAGGTIGGLEGGAYGLGHTDTYQTDTAQDVMRKGAESVGENALYGAGGGILGGLVRPIGQSVFKGLGDDASRLELSGGGFSPVKGAMRSPEGAEIAKRAAANDFTSPSSQALSEARGAVDEALDVAVGEPRLGAPASSVASEQAAAEIRKALTEATNTSVDATRSFKEGLESRADEMVSVPKARLQAEIESNIQKGGRLPKPEDVALHGELTSQAAKEEAEAASKAAGLQGESSAWLDMAADIEKRGSNADDFAKSAAQAERVGQSFVAEDILDQGIAAERAAGQDASTAMRSALDADAAAADVSKQGAAHAAALREEAGKLTITPQDAELLFSPNPTLRKLVKDEPDLLDLPRLVKQIDYMEGRVNWAAKNASPEQSALKRHLDDLIAIRDTAFPDVGERMGQMSKGISTKKAAMEQLGATRELSDADIPFGGDMNAIMGAIQRDLPVDRKAIEAITKNVNPELRAKIDAAIARLRNIKRLEGDAYDFEMPEGIKARRELGPKAESAGRQYRGTVAYENLTRGPQNLSGKDVTQQAVRHFSPAMTTRAAGLKNVNPVGTPTLGAELLLALQAEINRSEWATQEGKRQ